MADLSVANSPAPTVITFPDSPFKLHQPFPPAGDQPTAIDGLVEGIEEQHHLDLALEIGATLVQGYGLALPQVLPHDFSAPAGLIPPARQARRARR